MDRSPQGRRRTHPVRLPDVARLSSGAPGQRDALSTPVERIDLAGLDRLGLDRGERSPARSARPEIGASR